MARWKEKKMRKKMPWVYMPMDLIRDRDVNGQSEITTNVWIGELSVLRCPRSTRSESYIPRVRLAARRH